MGAIDSGNTAWILTSAALVFLMTPGVAFFYGGMVRAKAVLNMLMLEAAALSVTMIIWTLWGWSIAYAGSDIGGIFGDPASGFLLKDSMVAQDGVFTATGLNGNNYPVSVDVAFQVAFAMITVGLICGAIAERVKYSTWMIFVALWVTFDYAPMAHMVWNGGLVSADGAISKAIGAAAHDFAGGTVVHINAAVAALIIVLIIGKRKGFGTQPFRPHNVPFVMLGAFLLWFGWFGFNAGSAFAANGTAGYAWVSTSAATAIARQLSAYSWLTGSLKRGIIGIRPISWSFNWSLILIEVLFEGFALMFIESLDVFAVHLVDEVGAAVGNRLGADAAGAQVSEKLMYEGQQLRRLRRAAVFFCQLHHVCLPSVVGNKNFFDFINRFFLRREINIFFVYVFIFI